MTQTSGLYCRASRDRPRSVHSNTLVEFKNRGQVSREADFTKSVEAGQLFVTRPAIVLEGQGITTTCREYSAMRGDPDAGMKGILREKHLSVPSTMQNSHCNIGRFCIEMLIDSASGDGSKSWVVISLAPERYGTEISANSKLYMFTETATQLDDNCCIEKSVADVAFGTIKGKITAYEKFGIMLFNSEQTSDTSHG